MTATAPDLPALIRLAFGIANRYGRGDGDPESAALLGLARALQKYDPARGASLRTFAAQRIRRELQHAERDGTGWGRTRWDEIPRALRMQDEWDTLTPAEQEWVEAHLPRAYEAVSLSLDTPAPDWEGEPLRDTLADPAAEAGGAIIAQDWVCDLLNRLPPKEAAAVRLCVLEDRSQAEAARLVGCCQMEMSRRVRRGLARLRELWDEEE